MGKKKNISRNDFYDNGFKLGYSRLYYFKFRDMPFRDYCVITRCDDNSIRLHFRHSDFYYLEDERIKTELDYDYLIYLVRRYARLWADGVL